MPRVFVRGTAGEAHDLAARLLLKRIRDAESSRGAKPNFVVLLGVGHDGLSVYQRLVDFYRQRLVSFDKVVFFVAHEYCDIDAGHPAATRNLLYHAFFKHVNVKPQNVIVFDPKPLDPEAECTRFVALVRQHHGVDLAVGCTGEDGIFGLNMPGSSIRSGCRMKTLSQTTLNANAELFGGKGRVPARGLTVGMQDLMDAKEVLSVVTSEHRSATLTALTESPVTHKEPLSALQCHPASTVIADEAACSNMTTGIFRYYKDIEFNSMHGDFPAVASLPPRANISTFAHRRLTIAAQAPSATPQRRLHNSPVEGSSTEANPPSSSHPDTEADADPRGSAPPDEEAPAAAPAGPESRRAKVTKVVNVRLLRASSIGTGEEDAALAVHDELWFRSGRVIDPAKRFWEAQAEHEYAADVVIDAQGAVCSPGLIDIQINGAFGIDFTSMDLTAADVASVRKRLLAHGCTSFCPTVITSAAETYRHALPLLRAGLQGTGVGANILGVHLEGPYINPLKKGAHEKRYIRLPEKGFAGLVELYGESMDHVSIVTIAPELPGALDCIRGLHERGVNVSMGHSNATLREAEDGVRAGAGMVTHLFNAMRSFNHRDPGIIGCLGSSLEKKPYFGIIVDGLHTHPAAVRMAYKANPRGTILITDAMEAMGMPPGEYQLAGKIVDVVEVALPPDYLQGAGDTFCNRFVHRATLREPSDTLAGAVPTLYQCVQNFRAFTGCSTGEALLAATYHPAKCLNIHS
eukprot:gene18981-29234_t